MRHRRTLITWEQKVQHNTVPPCRTSKQDARIVHRKSKKQFKRMRNGCAPSTGSMHMNEMPSTSVLVHRTTMHTLMSHDVTCRMMWFGLPPPLLPYAKFDDVHIKNRDFAYTQFVAGDTIACNFVMFAVPAGACPSANFRSICASRIFGWSSNRLKMPPKQMATRWTDAWANCTKLKRKMEIAGYELRFMVARSSKMPANSFTTNVSLPPLPTQTQSRLMPLTVGLAMCIVHRRGYAEQLKRNFILWRPFVYGLKLKCCRFCCVHSTQFHFVFFILASDIVFMVVSTKSFHTKSQRSKKQYRNCMYLVRQPSVFHLMCRRKFQASYQSVRSYIWLGYAIGTKMLQYWMSCCMHEPLNIYSPPKWIWHVTGACLRLKEIVFAIFLQWLFHSLALCHPLSLARTHSSRLSSSGTKNNLLEHAINSKQATGRPSKYIQFLKYRRNTEYLEFNFFLINFIDVCRQQTFCLQEFALDLNCVSLTDHYCALFTCDVHI